MKDISLHYLRRCAAWATALREKYRSDRFFRTTVHVVALQCLLVVACLLALVVSLVDPGQSFWIFALTLIGALSLGVLLARIVLTPAREALSYQKLFMANVAHELRTPLSIIKTSTEVALIDDSLPADTRATFKDISHELDRLSEILNNLLSLSSLARPERMQFGALELGEVVSATLKRHAALARERDVRLVVRKHQDTLVWGNASALEQLVANLVKNAINYTPKGSKGLVTVLVEPKEDMMLLSVTDTGVGIAQDDLAHIFEPFYRADMSRTRTIKNSGSGLGLTMVNEIVRAHHGKIQIESARKKGTVVSVLLPKSASTSANKPAQKPDSPSMAVLLEPFLMKH